MGVLTLARCLVVLAACSPEVVTRPPPPPVNWGSLEAHKQPQDAASQSPTQRERDIADTYLKALTNADNAALDKLLGDEVHFQFAALVATDKFGKRDVIAAHDKYLGAYSPRTFRPTRTLLTDHSQAIEWTMNGKDKASGKDVGIRGITLVQTRDDGTITDIHLYFDRGVVEAQRGGGAKDLQGLPLPAVPDDKHEVVEQTNTPDEAANVKLVSDWLDDLEKQDDSKYAAAMASDVEITTLQAAKPAKGKAAASAYHHMMHRTFDNLDTQLDNAVGIGAYVVAEYHVVGTQKAKYLYAPVKDPLIKLGVVDVVRIEDHKIAKVWRYEDPLSLVLSP